MFTQNRVVRLYVFISNEKTLAFIDGHVFHLLIAAIHHTFVIVAILQMNNLYLYSLRSFNKEHLMYVYASCVLCILSTQTNHRGRQSAPRPLPSPVPILSF